MRVSVPRSAAAMLPLILCAAPAAAQRAATGADAPITDPASASLASPVTVTFDDRDYNGWTILGFDDNIWRPDDGNPGAHLNFNLDNFFIRIYNASSPDFIGDYTRKGPVEFSADLRWRIVRFGFTDVTRDLYFAMWDQYTDSAGVERTHVVMRPMGKVRGVGPNAPWRTYRVRIADPTSDGLPGGWLYWNFDAATPPTRTLPDGVTFRDIMSSIDRIQFTTATPGLFFGFTFFDVGVDNPTLRPLAGPNAGALATADITPGAIAPVGADVTTGFTRAGDNAFGRPDGRVDDADLQHFLAMWFDADAIVADRTTAGAAPGDPAFGVPDGVVDQADLDFYLAAWDAERAKAPSRRTTTLTP